MCRVPGPETFAREEVGDEGPVLVPNDRGEVNWGIICKLMPRADGTFLSPVMLLTRQDVGLPGGGVVHPWCVLFDTTPPPMKPSGANSVYKKYTKKMPGRTLYYFTLSQNHIWRPESARPLISQVWSQGDISNNDLGHHIAASVRDYNLFRAGGQAHYSFDFAQGRALIDLMNEYVPLSIDHKLEEKRVSLKSSYKGTHGAGKNFSQWQPLDRNNHTKDRLMQRCLWALDERVVMRELQEVLFQGLCPRFPAFLRRGVSCEYGAIAFQNDYVITLKKDADDSIGLVVPLTALHSYMYDPYLPLQAYKVQAAYYFLRGAPSTLLPEELRNTEDANEIVKWCFSEGLIGIYNPSRRQVCDTHRRAFYFSEQKIGKKTPSVSAAAGAGGGASAAAAYGAVSGEGSFVSEAGGAAAGAGVGAMVMEDEED